MRGHWEEVVELPKDYLSAPPLLYFSFDRGSLPRAGACLQLGYIQWQLHSWSLPFNYLFPPSRLLTNPLPSCPASLLYLPHPQGIFSYQSSFLAPKPCPTLKFWFWNSTFTEKFQLPDTQMPPKKYSNFTWCKNGFTKSILHVKPEKRNGWKWIPDENAGVPQMSIQSSNVTKNDIWHAKGLTIIVKNITMKNKYYLIT